MTEPDSVPGDSVSGDPGSGPETGPAHDDSVRSLLPTRRLIHKHAKAPKRMGVLRETAIIMVSALVLSWIIKSLLVQAFFIPSPSMSDTLVFGDRVLVSRLVPRVLDIHRGDIVVFVDPADWLADYVPPDRGAIGNAAVAALTAIGLIPQDTGDHLIKRVIGMPGDNVACCDDNGRVTVNGVAIDETSYIRPGSIPSQSSFNVNVPEGMLWVMGDNRQDSADSRAHFGSPGGPFVPIDNVVGTTFAVVWPFSNATIVRSPAAVFAGVPDP